MIKFLIKGIIRDKDRTVLPIIVIAIGVALTVLLSGFLKGQFTDILHLNSRYFTGHLNVSTAEYMEKNQQSPLDLALLNSDSLQERLEKEYPDLHWMQRITSGGMIDVLDSAGNSLSQGPGLVLAADFLRPNSTEGSRLNLSKALREGREIRNPGEAMISRQFAEKLKLHIGDEFTYFGSSMHGSLAFHKFTLVGTVQFGSVPLDKNTVLVDLGDARTMMDMADASTGLLGIFKSGAYKEKRADAIAEDFNTKLADTSTAYSPVMFRLVDQNDLGAMLDYSNSVSSFLIGIFVFAMSLVLWNTGLLGGLRRYKEFGIRLSMGETKSRIYGTLIIEAIIKGIIGTVLGLAIGLGIVYYLQVYGIDFSEMLGSSEMLMPNVIRAKYEPQLIVLGLIPGILANVFGTMISGIGIFKRETSSLFNELEV